MYLLKKTILSIILVSFLSACSSKKDIIYFNDLSTSGKIENKSFNPNQIQPNDILSVIVSSSNAELSIMFNLNQDQNQNSSVFSGYLVNLEGKITLPILGKIFVKGLTLLELEELVKTKLIDNKLLNEPIVTVRLMNAKFTILGEVSKPGTYTFSEQNITILQALGYAGDLTINGIRKDILLIREENNIKTYFKVDISSKDLLSSPYYYLKPNDVIYVNPNGPKVKTAGYIGNLGSFISVVSVSDRKSVV